MKYVLEQSDSRSYRELMGANHSTISPMEQTPPLHLEINDISQLSSISRCLSFIALWLWTPLFLYNIFLYTYIMFYLSASSYSLFNDFFLPADNLLDD